MSQSNGCCPAAMCMAELLSLFPLFGSFLVSYASATEYKYRECEVIANPFTEEGDKGSNLYGYSSNFGDPSNQEQVSQPSSVVLSPCRIPLKTMRIWSGN